MTESAYQSWWPLHLRVARGESLTPDEKSFYDATCQDFDSDEQQQPLRTAQLAKAKLQTLEVERTQLEQRRRQLDTQITALENRLSQSTRHPAN
ncbi:MAG: hypothetical protein ACKV2Q_15685 [Planctomycetaceae bacterium]